MQRDDRNGEVICIGINIDGNEIGFQEFFAAEER